MCGAIERVCGFDKLWTERVAGIGVEDLSRSDEVSLGLEECERDYLEVGGVRLEGSDEVALEEREQRPEHLESRKGALEHKLAGVRHDRQKVSSEVLRTVHACDVCMVRTVQSRVTEQRVALHRVLQERVNSWSHSRQSPVCRVCDQPWCEAGKLAVFS